MLRAEPELGIPIDDTTRLTSVFFADDSTLLSNSLESADYQVDSIVGAFCAASGASLNLEKCITLPLNNNETPENHPSAPNVTVARTGRPIKYLGIYVGHKLPSGYQAQILHDKYLASYVTWACRARTVVGRRTLASSLMLSQIWHITAVRPITDEMVKQWQRALTNYSLGSKAVTDTTSRHLLHQMWHHDKVLGPGIPHIASSIRLQRLKLLQRLMRLHGTAESPLWANLVLNQFSQCLTGLYRSSHPFDFLSYYPNTTSKWILLGELHPLWSDVWTQWAKTPMENRTQTSPSFDTLLNMPIWLTNHKPFLDDKSQNAGNMATTPILRRWCLQGARNGIRSLADVLQTGHIGFWPTFDQFRASMSANNPEMTVSLHMGRIRFDMVDRSKRIYDHLTLVYRRIGALHDIRSDLPHTNIATTSHPFSRIANKKHYPFETWSHRILSKAAYCGPHPTRNHPSQPPDQTDMTAAKTFMRQFRRAMRLLTPTHADVWVRIILRMIPVNGRFAFRQHIIPNATDCSHRCGDVETEEHAFHTCSKIQPLWSTHTRAWHHYNGSFEWRHLLHPNSIKFNDNAKNSADILHQLWIMLSGVCLHLIWRHHNLTLHQHKPIPPNHVLFELSFLLWMATTRRWLRLLDDADVKQATLAALQAILAQPLYSDLMAKYPRSLELETTFDVH